MQIVLLSGGSGKRLWPLSNDVRSKQFLKLFKNDKNEYESMIQRVYRQIKKCTNSNITIATSKTQKSIILNQLGDNINLSVEPTRRDAFPAIVLVSCYIKERFNLKDEEVVAICPIDSFVEDDFYFCLNKLEAIINSKKSNLALVGIKPTYPSEKYGYIIPKTNEKISFVEEFKEKPDKIMAQKYIERGALWNSGIFAFKLGYILELAHKLINFKDYQDLFSRYSELEKISFDYAVVEKEKDIQVVKYDGEWKDVGTWNTMAETMTDPIKGNVVMGDNNHNCNVINELDIPLICMGCEDLIIVTSSDGIIVSNKEQSSYIKPYVEKITNPIRVQEKSWGYYKILDVQPNSLIIKITLNKGHQMSYHSHENRDEIWNVLSGNAIVVLDGERCEVSSGDSIKIKVGTKHTIIAKTELNLIEIQTGSDLSKSDKTKYDLKN